MCEIHSEIQHCLTFICLIKKNYSFYIEIVRVKNTRIQTQICWWLLFVWYYIAYFHHKKLDNASTSKMSKTTNSDLLHIISVLSSSLYTHTHAHSRSWKEQNYVSLWNTKRVGIHTIRCLYIAPLWNALKGEKKENIVPLKILKWINMTKKEYNRDSE